MLHGEKNVEKSLDNPRAWFCHLREHRQQLPGCTGPDNGAIPICHHDHHTCLPHLELIAGTSGSSLGAAHADGDEVAAVRYRALNSRCDVSGPRPTLLTLVTRARTNTVRYEPTFGRQAIVVRSGEPPGWVSQWSFSIGISRVAGMQTISSTCSLTYTSI
jgi:hypothetical protein